MRKIEDKDIDLHIDRETLLQEYIPKAQYEQRLKAEALKRMVEEKVTELKAEFIPKSEVLSMFSELQRKVKDLENPYENDYNNILVLAQHNAFYDGKTEVEDIIDEMIDKLNERED